MKMVESFFINLLKSGQMRVEKGTFMFLNEFLFLFPVKTFLKLRERLIEKLGNETDDFLKEMGRYQVTHAMKRYSKTIKIEKLNKVKISEFGIKVMNLLGHGMYDVISFDEKRKKIIIISKNVPTAIEYPLIYGKKSKTPIDSFICGIWEEAYTRFLNVDMKCIETKCLACGDPYCQFEIGPNVKPK